MKLQVYQRLLLGYKIFYLPGMKILKLLNNPKDIDKVMSIEGYLKKQEAECLVENAKNAKKGGVIVEIGSYRGRSTCALAIGTKATNKMPVYAIEPHEQFIGEYGGVYNSNDRQEFFKNILKLGHTDIVRLVNVPSHTIVKCWDKKISFLWIDGDHRYTAVKKDLLSWSKFIIRGGKIALHDSSEKESGPYKAIQGLIKTDSSYKIVDRVLSITILEKYKD